MWNTTGGSSGSLWRMSQAGITATALTEVNVFKTHMADVSGRRHTFFCISVRDLQKPPASTRISRHQPRRSVADGFSPANPLAANYANGYLFFMIDVRPQQRVASRRPGGRHPSEQHDQVRRDVSIITSVWTEVSRGAMVR